jgi:UDP-glucose 4-epimerase
VIETARKVTGHTIPVEAGERRAGDLPVLIADSTKIKHELGWSPEFDNLHTILETAWHWHKNHPNGFAD